MRKMRGYQQKNFRVGWENEHFAAAILSKFCFISAPVKIGDDTGFDFMCTLFEERGNDLMPKNSFMIQIKSSARGFSKEIKKRQEMIEKLQIPYMVGIIDKETKTLTIYSGEGLCSFFALGSRKKVVMELKESMVRSFLKETEKQIRVIFPKVLKVKINSEYKDIPNLKEFEEVLIRSQKNISRMKNNSFIFLTPTGEKVIYYGPTSAKHFLPNFIDTAAETVVNLEKITIDKTKVSNEDVKKLEDLKKYLKENWVGQNKE